MRPLTARPGKVDVYSNGPPSIESLSMQSSGCVTDEKCYFSTSTRSMATKPDRVLGSNAGLLSTKSHKPVDHMAT